jgi:hypothetical protein
MRLRRNYLPGIAALGGDFPAGRLKLRTGPAQDNQEKNMLKVRFFVNEPGGKP